MRNLNSPKSTDWEVVYAVYDFFDRPLSGVADFQGVPHAFGAAWDEERDDYSEVYELKELDENTMDVIKEVWQMWLRWREAHKAGTLGPNDKHPAMAIDRDRYSQLWPTVSNALRLNGQNSKRATGEFKAVSEPGYEYRVCWSVI